MNPALLYYYYDSKETLYRAMLQRILGQLLTRGHRRDRARVHPRRPHPRIRSCPGEAARRAPALSAAARSRARGPQGCACGAGDHQHGCQRLPPVVRGDRGGAAGRRVSEIARPALHRDLDHRAGGLLRHRAAGGRIAAGYGTSGLPRALSEEFFAHAEEFALAASDGRTAGMTLPGRLVAFGGVWRDRRDGGRLLPQRHQPAHRRGDRRVHPGGCCAVRIWPSGARDRR